MALGHLTNGTSLDKVFNVFEHMKLKVVLFGQNVCLVFPKVTGKRTSMNFSKNELTGATPWHTKAISLEQISFLDEKASFRVRLARLIQLLEIFIIFV